MWEMGGGLKAWLGCVEACATQFCSTAQTDGHELTELLQNYSRLQASVAELQARVQEQEDRAVHRAQMESEIQGLRKALAGREPGGRSSSRGCVCDRRPPRLNLPPPEAYWEVLNRGLRPESFGFSGWKLRD